MVGSAIRRSLLGKDGSLPGLLASRCPLSRAPALAVNAKPSVPSCFHPSLQRMFRRMPRQFNRLLLRQAAHHESDEPRHHVHVNSNAPIGRELARRDQPDKPDDLRANTSAHLDFGLSIAPSESVSGKRVRFSADTMFDHYTSCLGCTDLNAYPSDLTDQKGKVIEPLVPKPKPGRRPPKHPRRMILNAIFYLKRTGLPVEVAAHGFSAEIHGLRILRGLLRCGQESPWA